MRPDNAIVMLTRVSVVPLLTLPLMACAADANHSDPVAPVILGVTAILVFAVIGRHFARRFGQPSVLGELIIGIALGNLVYLFGGDFILALREGTALFDIVDLSFSGQTLEQAAELVTIPNAGGLQSSKILPDPEAVYRVREGLAQAIEELTR